MGCGVREAGEEGQMGYQLTKTFKNLYPHLLLEMFLETFQNKCKLCMYVMMKEGNQENLFLGPSCISLKSLLSFVSFKFSTLGGNAD